MRDRISANRGALRLECHFIHLQMSRNATRASELPEALALTSFGGLDRVGVVFGCVQVLGRAQRLVVIGVTDFDSAIDVA